MLIFILHEDWMAVDIGPFFFFFNNSMNWEVIFLEFIRSFGRCYCTEKDLYAGPFLMAERSCYRGSGRGLKIEKKNERKRDDVRERERRMTRGRDSWPSSKTLPSTCVYQSLGSCCYRTGMLPRNYHST